MHVLLFVGVLSTYGLLLFWLFNRENSNEITNSLTNKDIPDSSVQAVEVCLGVYDDHLAFDTPLHFTDIPTTLFFPSLCSHHN